MRRAKKLADLPQAEEVVIWKKHESGPMSKHIWAPELHYLEGKWYIYFAGGEEMQLGRLSGQSAQPGLSVKTIGQQVIKLPPLKVQNIIADMLTALDEKIEVNESINKNLAI